MTPSELAKVREALECAEFELQPIPAECVTSVRIREALAILDREAGRKTRTTYRIEHRATYESEWHKQKGRYAKRERAEKCATYYDGPTRIIEVTESWKEPKP